MSRLTRALAVTEAVALEGCRIWRPAFQPDLVEIVSADARPRRFPTRVSSTLGICVKAGPRHDVRADGRALVYPGDTVCVRPPGCVWASEPAAVSFLSIDIAAAWLPDEELRGTMTFRARADLPDVLEAVRALRAAATALEAGGVLAALVSGVVDSGALVLPLLRDDPAGLRGVARAREFLAHHALQNPTLEEAAREAGMNKFVLVRRFRRAFGTTPHAYVAALRVERARTLLAGGMRSGDVGVACGFADQAHFTRWFRRLVGMPPGAYQLADSRVTA